SVDHAGQLREVPERKFVVRLVRLLHPVARIELQVRVGIEPEVGVTSRFVVGDLETEPTRRAQARAPRPRYADSTPLVANEPSRPCRPRGYNAAFPGVFPSGQRGRAVNPLALPSEVRILPPPFSVVASTTKLLLSRNFCVP